MTWVVQLVQYLLVWRQFIKESLPWEICSLEGVGIETDSRFFAQVHASLSVTSSGHATSLNVVPRPQCSHGAGAAQARMTVSISFRASPGRPLASAIATSTNTANKYNTPCVTEAVHVLLKTHLRAAPASLTVKLRDFMEQPLVLRVNLRLLTATTHTTCVQLQKLIVKY